jgi:hypothetical protein
LAAGVVTSPSLVAGDIQRIELGEEIIIDVPKINPHQSTLQIEGEKRRIA